ncbi:MAG: hypothetical protein AB7K24_24700, partial [Gemmataceae bacterium]
RGERAEPAPYSFQDLEQFYVICTRLLGAEPMPGSVVAQSVSDFQLTARFPAAPGELPTLHFRRLNSAARVTRLTAEEQGLFVRLVKVWHATGLDASGAPAGLHLCAEQVVAEAARAAGITRGDAERERIVAALVAEYATTIPLVPRRKPARPETGGKSFADLIDYLAARFVRIVDPKKVSREDPAALREARLLVEQLLDRENALLNRMERERAIDDVMDVLFGFGPLEMLLRFDRVEEIEISGPQQIKIRPEPAAENIGNFHFRDLHQLNLISDRLSGGEPAPGSVVEREVYNFWMKAQFPPSRLQAPTLHFRRLRPDGPPPPVMRAPRLPAAEQRLLVRFVQLCHLARLDKQSDERELRRLAAQAVDEMELADAAERERLIGVLLRELATD